MVTHKHWSPIFCSKGQTNITEEAAKIQFKQRSSLYNQHDVAACIQKCHFFTNTNSGGQNVSPHVPHKQCLKRPWCIPHESFRINMSTLSYL